MDLYHLFADNFSCLQSKLQLCWCPQRYRLLQAIMSIPFSGGQFRIVLAIDSVLLKTEQFKSCIQTGHHTVNIFLLVSVFIKQLRKVHWTQSMWFYCPNHFLLKPALVTRVLGRLQVFSKKEAGQQRGLYNWLSSTCFCSVSRFHCNTIILRFYILMVLMVRNVTYANQHLYDFLILTGELECQKFTQTFTK